MIERYFIWRFVNREQRWFVIFSVLCVMEIGGELLLVVCCTKGFWKLNDSPMRDGFFFEDVSWDNGNIVSFSAILNGWILTGFDEHWD